MYFTNFRWYEINIDFIDGGGWTVLQQRGDNGNPEDFFYKYWADYEQGFGDPEKVKTLIQLEIDNSIK